MRRRALEGSALEGLGFGESIAKSQGGAPALGMVLFLVVLGAVAVFFGPYAYRVYYEGSWR